MKNEKRTALYTTSLACLLLLVGAGCDSNWHDQSFPTHDVVMTTDAGVITMTLGDGKLYWAEKGPSPGCFSGGGVLFRRDLKGADRDMLMDASVVCFLGSMVFADGGLFFGGTRPNSTDAVALWRLDPDTKALETVTFAEGEAFVGSPDDLPVDRVPHSFARTDDGVLFAWGRSLYLIPSGSTVATRLQEAEKNIGLVQIGKDGVYFTVFTSNDLLSLYVIKSGEQSAFLSATVSVEDFEFSGAVLTDDALFVAALGLNDVTILRTDLETGATSNYTRFHGKNHGLYLAHNEHLLVGELFGDNYDLGWLQGKGSEPTAAARISSEDWYYYPAKVLVEDDRVYVAINSRIVAFDAP